MGASNSHVTQPPTAVTAPPKSRPPVEPQLAAILSPYEDPDYQALARACETGNDDAVLGQLNKLLNRWKTESEAARWSCSRDRIVGNCKTFLGCRSLPKSPLHILISRGHTHSVRAFLEDVRNFDPIGPQELCRESSSSGLPICMAMKAFNEDCFMLLLQYGAFDSSSFDFGQIASSLSGPTSPKQEVFLQNALDEVFKSSSCQSEANRQILCDHLARATCTVLIKQHFEMILSRCTKYHKYVASSEVIQRIIEYQPSYLSCLLSAGAISCEGERSAQMLTACIYDNDSRSLSLLQTAIRGGVSVKGGTQAFEKAFNRRFYQSVQFLLDSGIDFTSPQLLNCALSSEYGRTHWETWINSTPSKSVPVETVAFAINNHLSTDLLTRLVQYTVHPLPSELLFVAMYQHDALSLKTLLGLGANIDQSFSVPGTRHKPRTPLQHALLNCWEGCAILLIEAGANFPAPTSPEWNECVPGTFLKLCESNGDTTSLMEIFLGRWPDLLNLKVCAAQKTWRGTCAEIVAKAGKPQRLRFLLRRGALRKPSGERDYAIAGVLLQQLTELVLSIPPYSYDECKISDYSWCAKELIKWGGQVPPILNVGKRLPLAAAISEGNCILALHTTFLCYQKCGEHSLLRSLPQPIIQYIAELLLSHYISKKHELWLPPSFLVHFKE